jgi:hypothetical protein
MTEWPRKIFSYAFNGRSNPARISVGVSEDGVTCVYFPGVMEPCIVVKGHPIEIDISGNGPGPDICILAEASWGSSS